MEQVRTCLCQRIDGGEIVASLRPVSMLALYTCGKQIAFCAATQGKAQPKSDFRTSVA